MKFFNCMECKKVVINKNDKKTYTLIDIKNRGGLTMPSKDVIRLYVKQQKKYSCQGFIIH